MAVMKFRVAKTSTQVTKRKSPGEETADQKALHDGGNGEGAQPQQDDEHVAERCDCSSLLGWCCLN